MDFKDKIAIVTGGTSGIGKEIVKQLLVNGAYVVINYGSNEKQAAKSLDDLRDYQDRIMLIKADISNEEEVIKMYNQVKDKFDYLDYLVNNAGTNIDNWIESFSMEDFKKVVNVNFIGKMICTKHAIPLLKNSKTPSIVNISSGLGMKPCEESSPYCASAAAIINFTQASALELSKYRIRVNSICPGFTPTPLSLESWSKEEINHKKSINPLGRLGEAEDMANTVLFLLSNKASYINGENISINGGSKLK